MSKNLLSQKWQNILWSTLLTILGIACFPANPLVLTGLIEAKSYLVLFIIGWVVWAFGMVLVMAPIIMFPRRGGVAKGKSYVHTRQLVDTTIHRWSLCDLPHYVFMVSSLAIRCAWSHRHRSYLYGL